MWMIASALHSLVSILFPPRCFRCTKKEEAYCMRCVKESRKTLSVPLPYIVSLFDFRDTDVRRAIHAIKYYNRRDLVDPLAHALAGEVGKIPDIEHFVLVPIPMPRIRKLVRGYNQAELIARSLGKKLDLPVRTDILVRTRTPARQAKIEKRTDRARNQKGSFALTNGPSGLRIILVDDVTTTGATLNEARRTLLGKGAVCVLAATLAH